MRLRSFVKRRGPLLVLAFARPFAARPAIQPTNRRPTLTVDVLGSFAQEQGWGDLQVDELSFIVRNRIIGSSLTVIAIEVNGRLNLTLGATDVGSDFHRLFREQFIGALTEGIRG